MDIHTINSETLKTGRRTKLSAFARCSNKHRSKERPDHCAIESWKSGGCLHAKRHFLHDRKRAFSFPSTASPERATRESAAIGGAQAMTFASAIDIKTLMDKLY